MRAQLQYRLPQTPELLTICLTIVCVSFSPSSPFPVSRCLYLSWTLRCRRISGGGVLAFDVPITCREHGDRRLPAAGRAKPRQLGAPPDGTGKKNGGIPPCNEPPAPCVGAAGSGCAKPPGLPVPSLPSSAGVPRPVGGPAPGGEALSGEEWKESRGARRGVCQGMRHRGVRRGWRSPGLVALPCNQPRRHGSRQYRLCFLSLSNAKP